MFVLRLHAEHLQHFPDDVLDLEGDGLEMHLAGFDLRVIQNVVDHRQQRFSGRVDDVVAFFEQYGADPAAVSRELGGFATESALRLSDARVRAYGIQGVPAIVVDGRFVTGVSQAGGEDQLFKLLDDLVQKARQQ